MEDLIYYATQQYRPFTQGLRDLVDRLPRYFFLLMNFTLASPEAVGDIGTVLGAALVDRLTDQIYFSEPSEEEALDYVHDLLKKHRVKDADIKKRGLPDTYPFDEEALHTLIRDLPSRKPRHVNNRCSVAITKSMQSRIIFAPGQGIIDREFVRKLEKESLELDEFSMR